LPLSQANIDDGTPLGANVVFGGGTTFRTWAPAATAVYLVGPFNGWTVEDEPFRMVKDGQGIWSGFVPGVGDGTEYKFYVVGTGSKGYKRDPFARELSLVPPFPNSNCVVRDPGDYPWHDQDFRMPEFRDLVVYQFHIGVYYAADGAGNDARRKRAGTFLDVVDRLEYLVDLGVNAIEPLPVIEFPTSTSEGYNYTDYFSPEMAYTLPLGPDLTRLAKVVNRLLVARGKAPLKDGVLDSQVNQLKAMVDLFHVYGIAVLFDVVYNHAGGSLDDESLYYFDRQPTGDDNRSLYFTDQGWAGGKVFAYWNGGVRQFLIDNANSFLRECHCDGFRYDEVTVIDRFGGWNFCQNLTDTAHFVNDRSLHVAEYWNPDQTWVVKPTSSGGAGFDAVWSDRLRDAVRGAVARASAGSGSAISMDAVRDGIYPPSGFSAAWKSVIHLENHDIVFDGKGSRVARLADGSNPRSWFARSRSRLAMGLLMTSPGIPMIFMGEEFLEDKSWSDSNADLLLFWDGLKSDKVMRDYLRFSRELIGLRKHQPALRSEAVNVFHVHDQNRVVAFQRWVVGSGRDVVVAASLSETAYHGYAIGFPGPGSWKEVFNSDVYDNWVNPNVDGNGGGVTADGPPLHGLPCSAGVVIPANGFVVFARDGGD
jgi:1,4-alpha-glucan branching enzyme